MRKYYMATLIPCDLENEYQWTQQRNLTDEEYAEISGTLPDVTEDVHVDKRPNNATVLGDKNSRQLNMIWSVGE